MACTQATTTEKQFQMFNDTGAKGGMNLLVESLFVALPCGEQKQASRVHDAIDEQIDGELRVVRKLRMLKSALMADLLTSRLRVPEGVEVQS